MPPFFPLFSLLLSAALAPAPQALASPPTTAALKICPTQCGSVSLPYPFGSRSGCYRPGFQVECNSTSSLPMIRLPGKTRLNEDQLVAVTNISLDLDVVAVQLGVATYCGAGMNQTTDEDGRVTVGLNASEIGAMSTNLEGSPYTLSYTRNKFVVLGCYAIGEIIFDVQPVSVCASTCTDGSDIVNGTCSVISGCCQSVFPKSLKDFSWIIMGLNTGTMNNTYKQAGPCSYAFVMDSEQYKFQTTDLYDYVRSRGKSTVPVVLDWGIGNHSCSQARTLPDYACGANAGCVDSTNGPGYLCICNQGYTGNPYVADGCQDIDECGNPVTNICSDICKNTIGSFQCSCPKGTYGNGLKAGEGCIKKRSPILQVTLGCGLGLLLLLLCVSWFYHFLKQREFLRLREKFFEDNGGLIMQKIILSQHGATQIAKIFTEKDLTKATNNYNEKRILGQGGFGTVYKGILQDKTVVAIKKSKIEDSKQIEQFINEIVILSQLSHRNVVKIIGCCLESQVPSLVYDYVPNKTLFYHIHDADRVSSLSWNARLRIASEVADGIAYLHSFASQPIIHRDIKSSNILLDFDYSAKVSDFGISKIVPLEESAKSTMLQGTTGYMDPESFETGQITIQSDVYSFGVVLAELLTGKMHIITCGNATTALASYFVKWMNENRLFDIMEPRVRDEGNLEQLRKVGNLTRECLRKTGVERPSMREVAAELTKLRTRQTHATHPPKEEVQVSRNMIPSDEPCFLPSFSTSSSITNTIEQDDTINWSAYVR